MPTGSEDVRSSGQTGSRARAPATLVDPICETAENIAWSEQIAISAIARVDFDILFTPGTRARMEYPLVNKAAPPDGECAHVERICPKI
jgi:hypothetical protein